MIQFLSCNVDASILWNSTSPESCGHPTNLPDALKTRKWWPTCNAAALEAVKQCFQYHPAPDDASVCIKAVTLKTILEKSLVSRHFEGFDTSCLDEDFLVTIPSNPSIFWIATFIDFLDNLKPQDKGDGHVRVRPKLSFSKSEDALLATIVLDKIGVKKLSDFYKKSATKSGATPALLRIGTNIGDLENHGFTTGRLIEMRGECCKDVKFPMVTQSSNFERVQFDEDQASVTLRLKN